MNIHIYMYIHVHIYIFIYLVTSIFMQHKMERMLYTAKLYCI